MKKLNSLLNKKSTQNQSGSVGKNDNAALPFVTNCLNKWPWTKHILPIFNFKWHLIMVSMTSLAFLLGIISVALASSIDLSSAKDINANVANALGLSTSVPSVAYGLAITVLIIGLFLWLGSLFLIFWRKSFFGWFTIPKININSKTTLIIFNIVIFISYIMILVGVIAVIFNIVAISTWGQIISEIY